tara:strand:+ start:148 stop:402 length:255 start_codon:yes stop_codon:yes gene_type:complete
MEHNMTEPNTPSTDDQMWELSNRASRSMIAVIDTVVQRGGFKGEELTTIGQLRDQCIQMIQMCETRQQEQASTTEAPAEEPKKK